MVLFWPIGPQGCWKPSGNNVSNLFACATWIPYRPLHRGQIGSTYPRWNVSNWYPNWNWVHQISFWEKKNKNINNVSNLFACATWIPYRALHREQIGSTYPRWNVSNWYPNWNWVHQISLREKTKIRSDQNSSKTAKMKINSISASSPRAKVSFSYRYKNISRNYKLT